MANQQELTTYIALFHYRDHAAAAIRDLENAGFPSGAFTIIGSGNGSSYGDAQGGFGAGYGYGGLNSLDEVGVPDRDRKRLQDGLNQGGTVLVLEGTGDRAEEIEKIFHSHSTDKIDETDVERGASAAPALAAAPVLAAAAQPVSAAESMSIPIVEEELLVGKREVDRGGVRVFQRTVETPVSTSVKLHEEHVIVERRPVDRAVTETDLLQGDQVIEMTGTAEEAVVGKSARVVEEVLIGKQATDHTETIQDTVRHTEVEIEPTTTTEVEGTTKLRNN